MCARVVVVLSLVHPLGLNEPLPLTHSVGHALSRCLFLSVLFSVVRGAFVRAGFSVVLSLVHHLSLNVCVLMHYIVLVLRVVRQHMEEYPVLAIIQSYIPSVLLNLVRVAFLSAWYTFVLST